MNASTLNKTYQAAKDGANASVLKEAEEANMKLYEDAYYGNMKL